MLDIHRCVYVWERILPTWHPYLLPVLIREPLGHHVSQLLSLHTATNHQPTPWHVGKLTGSGVSCQLIALKCNERWPEIRRDPLWVTHGEVGNGICSWLELMKEKTYIRTRERTWQFIFPTVSLLTEKTEPQRRKTSTNPNHGHCKCIFQMVRIFAVHENDLTF